MLVLVDAVSARKVEPCIERRGLIAEVVWPDSEDGGSRMEAGLFDRPLPHAAEVEPLVVYGLLIADAKEVKVVCKMLYPSDFIDDYLGGLFARIKNGTLRLDRLMPRERKRLVEEVIKPGVWGMGTAWQTNLRWYSWMIRDAALDRKRILSAEAQLKATWERVKDNNRWIKQVADRESMREV